GDAAISLERFRKDVIIELLNEQGVVAKAYKVYRCWVSEYQALPELDANAHAIAIEHMVLQNEGWERDVAGTEPTQTTHKTEEANGMIAQVIPLSFAGDSRSVRLRELTGNEEYAVLGAGTPEAIALLSALLAPASPGEEKIDAVDLVAADRDRLLAAVYDNA